MEANLPSLIAEMNGRFNRAGVAHMSDRTEVVVPKLALASIAAASADSVLAERARPMSARSESLQLVSSRSSVLILAARDCAAAAAAAAVSSSGGGTEPTAVGVLVSQSSPRGRPPPVPPRRRTTTLSTSLSSSDAAAVALALTGAGAEAEDASEAEDSTSGAGAVLRRSVTSENLSVEPTWRPMSPRSPLSPRLSAQSASDSESSGGTAAASGPAADQSSSEDSDSSAISPRGAMTAIAATSSESFDSQLVFSAGGMNLLGGTLDGLVRYFVLECAVDGSPVERAPEQRWLEAFARSHCTVMESSAVVDALEAIVPPGASLAVGQRVLAFVSRWLMLSPSTFSSDTILRNRITMLMLAVASLGDLGTMLASTLQLLDRMASSESVSLGAMLPSRLVRSKTVSAISSRQLRALSKPSLNQAASVSEAPVDAQAGQLTGIHWKQYSQLSATELLSLRWMQESSDSDAPSAILPLIRDVNRLIQWLQLSILREMNTKHRAQVLTQVLQLGRAFLHINNYLGAMAVLACVDSAAIYRLRKSFDRLPPKVTRLLDKLRRCFSSDRSFRAYREIFRLCEGPAIPYIGVHLADLVQLSEAQPRKLAADDSSHVVLNFSRVLSFDAAVQGLLSKRIYPYSTEVNPAVLEWCETQLAVVDMSISEETMFAMSQQLEPPES